MASVVMHQPLVSSAPQQGMVVPVVGLSDHSPAYRALHENGLICNDYRVNDVESLNMVRGTWDMMSSTVLQCMTLNGCCCLMKYFTVNAGCVRKGSHSNGTYIFYGEGVHVIASPFVSVGEECQLTVGAIVNGTKAIITVTQGFVGYAIDCGQPKLLPPGLHQWDSRTLEFKNLIDLSSNLICLGPYTLVTVDEGYAAVTQDNGKQKILDGGQAYMLTHRNWKFEKFMTKKLQTNDIGPIQVTTGDNVPLKATATTNWIIEDASKAARMAANTMPGASTTAVAGAPSGANAGEFDISKLREDVIRQVTASLAAFIGSVSYSTHGHAAVAARVEGDHKSLDPDSDQHSGRKALFDRSQLGSSVDHANEICQRYGVKVLSINLISASPADKGLLDALSQGAVATVAAEQAETAARGQAQALLTQAKAESEAAKIRAQGDAAAEAIRAEGALKAAKNLQDSTVAVELAKMKAAGNCLKEGQANSFFFGLQSAADLPGGVLGGAFAADAMAQRR